MLRSVVFDVNFFDGEADRANSQKRVLVLLEALTLCDQFYLQEHPETPLIYESGIKYKVPAQFEEDEVSEVGVLRRFIESKGAPANVYAALEDVQKILGGERFREIPRIIENGGGDCDNVSSWRAAELRRHGIAAKPYITWRRRADGGMTYHVVVAYPDGPDPNNPYHDCTHEDPSLLLGMGGAERAQDRAEEERKLGERTREFVRGLALTRTVRGGITTMLGINRGGTAFEGVITPQPFTGLQYTIPFQTDDSYEDWSPTRPPQFYYDPRYPGGNIQNTPYFNTRMRDPDDDWDDKYDDKFDGEIGDKKRALLRRLRQAG